MPYNPYFVGPSYNLESKPASVQRTINMVPVANEPGNERVRWVLKDCPGLTAFSITADLQGLLAFNDAVQSQYLGLRSIGGM